MMRSLNCFARDVLLLGELDAGDTSHMLTFRYNDITSKSVQ